MGVPRLSLENAEFAQAVVSPENSSGLTPFPTWGSREFLLSGTGAQENRLYLLFFPYPDYHIPGNFTISRWWLRLIPGPLTGTESIKLK